ncbi:hypothetical protein GEMRC1_011998 [Eukaryota sp. GEM-RC1]
MTVVVLLLCCFALGSLHQWTATGDGVWSDKNNWEPGLVSNGSSFVVLPPQMTSITVTVDSSFSISSLKISSNVVLLFQNNSTLTVSDSFVINGGTLNTDISSPLSFTSTDSLIVDADIITLVSHKLIISRVFDWKRGVIDLDDTSELLLINCTTTSYKNNATLRSSEFLNVWGNCEDGVLGGDLSENQGTPTEVRLFDTVKQASVGFRHSLVLLTNGDVYTSGSNDNGRLGFVGGDRKIHEKIQISRIIQVLSTWSSSFALSVDGSVLSWGGNGVGELGLGDLIDRHVPTLIPDLNDIQQIAGRHRTLFALTRDGDVFGWGFGEWNILCRQSIDDVISPVLIENLHNVKFIAAGITTSFSSKKMGDSEIHSTPNQFAKDIQFSVIDVIGYHALGIDVAQNLWSWGVNDFGRLGTESSSNSIMPVQLKVTGEVITVAAGYTHSIAVDVNNDVWSWGLSQFGSLGRVVSPSAPSHLPGIITGLTGERITGVTIYARSNIAFSSAPFDAIRSSSKDGILTLQDTNQITGSVNCSGIQLFNLIYLPIYLSGTLNLLSDSFFFLSNFNLGGILIVDSPW